MSEVRFGSAPGSGRASDKTDGEKQKNETAGLALLNHLIGLD